MHTELKPDVSRNYYSLKIEFCKNFMTFSEIEVHRLSIQTILVLYTITLLFLFIILYNSLKIVILTNIKENYIDYVFIILQIILVFIIFFLLFLVLYIDLLFLYIKDYKISYFVVGPGDLNIFIKYKLYDT
jgi:hypothetical protein